MPGQELAEIAVRLGVGDTLKRSVSQAKDRCRSSWRFMPTAEPMPSAFFDDVGMRRLPRDFDQGPVVDTRHSSYPQRAFRVSAKASIASKR